MYLTTPQVPESRIVLVQIRDLGLQLLDALSKIMSDFILATSNGWRRAGAPFPPAIKSLAEKVRKEGKNLKRLARDR